VKHKANPLIRQMNKLRTGYLGMGNGCAKSHMVTLRHASDIDATACVIVSDAEQDEH
jgi:hypothetical protein